VLAELEQFRNCCPATGRLGQEPGAPPIWADGRWIETCARGALFYNVCHPAASEPGLGNVATSQDRPEYGTGTDVGSLQPFAQGHDRAEIKCPAERR
jgi:hypothetical protein